MQTSVIAALVFVLAMPAGSAPLNFRDALTRAMQLRASPDRVERAAGELESLPTRTLPVVRAEAAVNSAENVDVLTQGVVHFQALTALVNVDYPLFGGQTPALRRDEARANAALYRGRAEADADEVFRQTLDAFAQLWLVQQRLALVAGRSDDAGHLRRRAAELLARGEISNLTAASWDERALAAQNRVVDLQLQRIDAETRLRQLIGDNSDRALELVLDLDDPVPKRSASEASLEEEKRRVAFAEAVQLRRPQGLLSAFAGVANVPSVVNDAARTGTFGIYGIRFSLSLPMFDNTTAMQAAEAKLELEDASRVRAAEEIAAKRRVDALRLAAGAAQKRIDLLAESVDIAATRQQSVARLVSSGVRPEADLVEAANDVASRQSDLLGAKVERWKVWELLKHEGAAP